MRPIPVFSGALECRELSRISVFLGLTRILFTNAHHGDCSEIRRRRLESGGLLAQRVNIRALKHRQPLWAFVTLRT
jgi:hypothetical protein